jgi:hypothetical protein
MTDLTLFEPAPDGPPEGIGKGKYAPLYAWLNEHPGEWAVIRGKPNAGLHTSLRKRGYEARSITRSDGLFDIYVRVQVEEIAS